MEDTENEPETPRKNRRCCICISVLVCLLLVLVAAALAFYFIFFRKGSLSPLGTCGDCHCIAGNGNECPSPTPKTDFSNEMIQELASQTALNPYLLDCNPYASDEFPDLIEPCTTNPPQEETLLSLGEEAVCGLHYESYNNATCSKEYSIKSYISREQAETAGAFVTHAGACGACSTTQDLAAYLKSPDLTTEGSYCAKQSIVGDNLGLQCYQDLGMTESCAMIWVYNSLNTAEKCLKRCATTKNKPNNGSPPECTLNDCLQCDEDVSGPIFKQVAARTRRRSGLLSAIVRPCDALVPITQESCPETLPLMDEE